MSVIKTILGLIVAAAIIVAGYWLYVPYLSTPDSPYWAELNSNAPDPLRSFSCKKLKERAVDGGPSCEGVQ